MLKLITNLQFGDKAEKDKSFKEKVNALVRKSTLDVTANFNKESKLNWLLIEITGELSKIPSIKNNIHKRGMFLQKNVLAKIKAMDFLYMNAIKKYKEKLYYGEQEILVFLSFSNHADNISAMETVQDWLEPSSKQKGGKLKKRGWGIGLIEDDKQVIPISLRSGQGSMLKDYTYILAIPYERVREQTLNYLSELFILGGSKNEKNI